MRIRTAIFAVYVAASAVGFYVLMFFVLAEVRPRYVSAVRANLHDAVRISAAGLAGRTLPDVVASLRGKSTFRIQVIDAEGRVRFDSAATEGHEGGSLGAGGFGSVPESGTSGADPGARELEVSATESLELAGGERALLVFSRSFRSVNAVIWSERVKLAAMSLGVAAVMLAAGWWLSARLTDSLERLTGYARDVRDGRTVAVPQSRLREIADLGRGFEEMRDALEGRQHVERYTQALAHELKSPLAAIRGAAELLDEELPPAQRARFQASIRAEAARIHQMVERILELSSLEARKALQRTELVAADELAVEAATAMEPAFAAARVNLVTQAAPATVRGERVLLREALVNLLHNALEFSAPGGEVCLAVGLDGGRVRWSVEDAGPGVPDYALPRVFERFYSLPRPGQTEKSTGLGLALVREIAHLHGGEAALANRPGGGARATLEIPAAT